MQSAYYPSFAITATTTAQALRSTAQDYKSTQVNVRNLSTYTNEVLYIGGSDVSTSNGYPIYARESINLADIKMINFDGEIDLSKVYVVSNVAALSARILYLKVDWQ